MKKILLFSITLLLLQNCQVPSNQLSDQDLQYVVKETLKISINDAYVYYQESAEIDLASDFVILNLQDTQNLQLFEKGLRKISFLLVPKIKNLALSLVENLYVDNPLALIQGQNFIYPMQQFDSLAFTHFFEYKFRNQIYEKLKPEVNNLIIRDLGVGYSLEEIWFKIQKNNSNLNQQLADYVLNKILDKYLILIGYRERAIRYNPEISDDNLIIKAFAIYD